MTEPQKVSRRDFLKLASLLPMAAFARPLQGLSGSDLLVDAPNVLLFVFDAWSAQHLEIYGYPRETMPNLTRFADRALVYHKHFSAGTFTTPGTATLLTGLYPWTHRAFQIRSGISDRHTQHQIFAALQGSYETTGYSQNKYADLLLGQFGKTIDRHIPISHFNLQNGFLYSHPLLKNDSQLAFSSLEANIIGRGKGFDGSLFLGPLIRSGQLVGKQHQGEQYQDWYPRGLPEVGDVFLLEDLADGMIETLKNLGEPGFLYFHIYPPHEPYRPDIETYSRFENDEYWPEIVAPHQLSVEFNKADELRTARRFYDEYLSSWDREFGRVIRYLEESGLLENSYVIITADHGEMHDRGEIGHISRLIYNPLIHIPLLVSQPGQKTRQDILMNTSSADLLPTIAHLCGLPVPWWAEGNLLPALGGEDDYFRSIYSMDAKHNSSFTPLEKFSISLTKKNYRLTYYNYPKFREYEFYDLQEDPGESTDLFPSHPATATMMMDELHQKISEINQPYRQFRLPIGIE